MQSGVEQLLDELNTTDNIKALFRRYGRHYGWYAIAAVSLGNIAALVTGTIINVAIPDIMGAFGINQDEAQWLSTAYLAASTVTMLLTSWMVQAVGLRNTMITAMSLFMTGSLIGGLSPNTDVMIIARILQGTTAGFIGPLSMSIIFQVFPPGKQGMAMGVTSVGVILAPSVGPAIGGVLVDNLSWRYVFLMGIPFSALCLPMAMLYLPGREPDAVRTPFDWNGLLLLSIALVCLLVGLSNGEKEGWGSDVILTYFGIAFVLGWLFIYWQRHYRYPLLNLKLFANRNFAIMSLVGFVFGAGLYGSTYLVPLFLQIIQRMSPTDAGIMMMPAGLTLALVFPLSGRLADRYDLRILISAGILFFACSFYLMNGADPDTSFWTFAWWLILGRIGIGLVMPSLSMGALRELPMELVTQGSGALNFIRQLGGAYGVNLMSLTLARRTNFHTDQLAATQAYGNTEMSEWIEGLRQLLAEAGLVPVEQTAAAMHYLGMVVYRQAMVLGFRDAFLIVSLAFLFTLLPTWLLRNTRKPAPMAPA